MSTFIPPVRGKSWVFQVTALCIVLGMLLALSLKTQRQAASEGIPNRWPALRAEFGNLKRENTNLQKDLADYKARYEKLARDQAAGLSGAKGLQQTLDDAKMMAGNVAVHGPGIIVTLSDSPKVNPSETSNEMIENYLVHDYDIRKVVNELFSMGAEAISINGQRIVAISSIRCAGAPILINQVQTAPPFRISAIGNAANLKAALEMPGGVGDDFFPLDMIEIKKVADIVIPAYAGSMRFNSAKPVFAHKK